MHLRWSYTHNIEMQYLLREDRVSYQHITAISRNEGSGSLVALDTSAKSSY